MRYPAKIVLTCSADKFAWEVYDNESVKMTTIEAVYVAHVGFVIDDAKGRIDPLREFPDVLAIVNGISGLSTSFALRQLREEQES
jgi:hypothetical protein